MVWTEDASEQLHLVPADDQHRRALSDVHLLRVGLCRLQERPPRRLETSSDPHPNVTIHCGFLPQHQCSASLRLPLARLAGGARVPALADLPLHVLVVLQERLSQREAQAEGLKFKH